ncbi:ATP-binding protein [uncultured Adlercreutzia sp.]|uniref:ATP-binding protein n=1 Tax=uncultured Adlercreutzia sp. TaxID=875803 RepID=UPI0025EAC21A|nr:DUF4143 domain-containing protein [uncultured Adlercreutzia sp.]
MGNVLDGVASHYRPRIVDDQIKQYLSLFGAIEVSGTKWCGKTWSALAHGKSVIYVDRKEKLPLVQADPAYALAGEVPHVIDEWQRVPAIWDTVRHAVDESAGRKGRWILTGSSTPLRPGERGHSGAGRIGRIRMHTMTLQESGDSSAGVSLRSLFEHRFAPVSAANGIEPMAELVCRGGWPEETSQTADAAQIVVRGYLSLIFEEGVPRFGGDSEISRRTALSLARNLGQSPTQKTIARDVFSLLPEEDPTESQLKTVASHLTILKRLYMIDEVPGWAPASRSPLRMRTKPKLYFADPSMAVGLLGLSSEALLDDWQTLGLAFENLVMRDLDVYARALPSVGHTPLHYYHDDSGLEVDAIIEKADGNWAAIEIKLSQDKVDKAAKNLLRLERKLQNDKRGYTPPPTFLAVVTGMGDVAYRRPDGIYVVPIRALGA